MHRGPAKSDRVALIGSKEGRKPTMANFSSSSRIICFSFVVGVLSMAAAPFCMGDLSEHFGLLVQNQDQLNDFLRSSKPKPLFSAGGATHVDIGAHRFYGRLLNGRVVVVVKTEPGTLNAGLTAQLMLTMFRGMILVIHYGRAGSPDLEKLNLGDFAIISKSANVGNWKWQNLYDNKEQGVAKLQFEDFNIPISRISIPSRPNAVTNLLNRIWYQKQSVLISFNRTEDYFWLDSSSRVTVPNITLESCSKRRCLPYEPKIVAADKGCSSDIYVENQAYAKYLLKTLGCQTIEQASASVATVCKTYGVGFASVKAISNRAGVYSVKDKNVDRDTLNRVISKNSVTIIGAIFNRQSQPRVQLDDGATSTM